MSSILSEYERGKLEGRNEARMDEAFTRLNKINGSVERHAKSNEALAREMKAGFESIAGEIRNMQEEARIREASVKVAAETLAKETERRRVEEEVPVRAWNLRANKATVISVAIAALAVLEALHGAHVI